MTGALGSLCPFTTGDAALWINLRDTTAAWLSQRSPRCATNLAGATLHKAPAAAAAKFICSDRGLDHRRDLAPAARAAGLPAHAAG